MRIRTDGDYSHRKSTIESCANHYDCNKTKAMLLAADQVPQLHDAVEDVMDMDSLTAKQREQIAERFSKARGIDVEIETVTEVSIE